MTASAMTRDPDLDKAIEDMRWAVYQLRGLEERLRSIDLSKDYRYLARLEFERSDVRGEIRARAVTLNMPWRTLMLFVEETDRLTKKHGRRPTVQMVDNAVEAAREWAARASQEADASIVLMQFRAQMAKDAEGAAFSAKEYLEACR